MSQPKKVLLVYSYYIHHKMVERLASEMGAFGVTIDILCTDNYRMMRLSGIRFSPVVESCLRLLASCGFLRRRKFSRKLFSDKLFRRIASQYDLVDFHVCIPSRLPLMKACTELGVPYDVMLWGSDILRATPEEISRMEYAYSGCRYIKAATSLQAAVSEKYGGRYDHKFRTVYLGVGDFDAIDAVKDSTVSALHESITANKEDVIIACGYNAHRPQQHLRIIDCLASLPEDVKSRLVLLLQMTYPSDPEYIGMVEEAASRHGLRYKLFDKHLSDEEVAAVRKLCDVVVNMQITDAFSASLQGHIYAGGILLAGEWLDYPVLDNNGIYYIKVNFDTLTGTVADVLARMDYYESQCAGNPAKMRAQTSWQAVSGKWAECYRI